MLATTREVAKANARFEEIDAYSNDLKYCRTFGRLTDSSSGSAYLYALGELSEDRVRLAIREACSRKDGLYGP